MPAITEAEFRSMGKARGVDRMADLDRDGRVDSGALSQVIESGWSTIEARLRRRYSSDDLATLRDPATADERAKQWNYVVSLYHLSSRHQVVPEDLSEMFRNVMIEINDVVAGDSLLLTSEPDSDQRARGVRVIRRRASLELQPMTLANMDRIG